MEKCDQCNDEGIFVDTGRPCAYCFTGKLQAELLAMTKDRDSHSKIRQRHLASIEQLKADNDKLIQAVLHADIDDEHYPDQIISEW